MMIPSKIIRMKIVEGALNLMGKFLGARLNIDIIYEWDFQRWKIEGRFDLVAIPNGFFMIKFISEANFQKLMYGGPWMFGQRAMFLR